MIIVRIKTGLGSQMFQYAFARFLSLKNKDSLILDVTSFTKNKPRDFALHHFNITGKIIRDTEEITHLLTTYPFRIVKDTDLRYHPAFMNLKGNIYLDGYWQSWRYFEPIREIIASDFKFRSSPKSKNRKILQEIRCHNSVCIHFRRGDHVHNPYVNKTHGVVPANYYEQAIAVIATKVKSPQFYVFSDDIEWVKQHFVLSSHPFRIVDINDVRHPQEDLRLMTECKHHIIANSTLSWWGAWLAKSDGQIVCAPKRWFINPQFSSRDMIPQNWIQI